MCSKINPDFKNFNFRQQSECDKDEGCDIENTEKTRSSPNPSSSINAGKRY